MPSVLRGLSALLIYLLAQLTFAQDDELKVKELLSKVSDALRTSNFRGRLTYEYSGKLEIIEIAHTVVDGIEHDRVYYLNGPDRALVKNGRSADCLNQGRTLMQGGKIRLPDGVVTRLDSTYSFKMLGEERVAGRNSWVVQVLPKDKYRHSVIIAIDQDSYLPTKTLFVSSTSKVLERLHFVALETGDHLAERIGTRNGEQEKDVPEADRGSAEAKGKSNCKQEEALVRGSEWRPEWVPPGFVLARYGYSDVDGHMETYTDGLAAFSVFTKSIGSAANGSQAASSSFKKGATALVMRLLPDIAPSPIHVSVLGEIPAETASRILSSVKSTDL